MSKKEADAIWKRTDLTFLSKKVLVNAVYSNKVYAGFRKGQVCRVKPFDTLHSAFRWLDKQHPCDEVAISK